MSQGWSIDNVAHKITFLEAPAAGTGNIVVKEYAVSAVGGTDCWALGAWNGEYGYPVEVEFFSDRLFWAGTAKDLQTIWGSNIGDYTNYGKSTPIVDSDGLTFAINTRQVNAVMDLVPLDKLIVLAKGGEFLMTGGVDEVVTPSTIGVKPQSYRGTGGLQAKVVGDTAIFVQEQGQRVFDIGYKFEQDGYRPQDISVWAEHLVEGRRLVRMEWMPAPWSVLPFVRDDGVMLGCTYMPEQEVIGWHQHDTDGTILDVVCLPGETQTELHLLVQRTINGVSKVYLEQMADAFVDDVRDWCYLDAAVTYDGRNTAATTVTLSGSGWTEDDTLTLTASSALFVGASDVGDGFTVQRTVAETDPATGLTTDVVYTVRVVIAAYVSATVVQVNSIGAVPAPLQGVATADWVLMRSTMSGLSHLEGKLVSILSDGSVLPQQVVTGGKLELPSPGGVVQIGLPYRALLETLEVNAPGGEAMRGNKKLLQSVGLLVKDARGLKAGSRLDFLDDLAQREFEDYGAPTQPLTGYARIPISAEWGENNGHVFVVSDDPLPAEILSLLPRLMSSDAG